jgi:nickel/cobalt exporter
VIIVGVAAVLLGATAKLMGNTVRIIEIVSYGLIMLLGARLLWVKGRNFIAALHALKAKPENANTEARDNCHCNHAPTSSHVSFHCHRAAHHEHEPDILPCDHVHGPEPQKLSGRGGWGRGLSAIVAVGMRPCSGAIIVLVFALAQGLFWAGIVSTFVMGFGTAITVAAIATLAVGAKALAKRVASRPTGYGEVLIRGIEFAAAALVLAFGVLLLTGYMASERLMGI